METGIAINTLAFQGYSWETVLEEIARAGVGLIEPVYISKYVPALCEDDFTIKNAKACLRTIRQAGLRVRSVASHMDMGAKDSVRIFQRRMEFARALGAEVIITNTSSLENEPQFFDNMTALCRAAADLEIVIALENPGDGSCHLLSSASDGMEILHRVGSDHVKINYDFSNIYTLSCGEVTWDPCLDNALDHIAHLHVKNVRLEGGMWRVCALGEGVIDYTNMFQMHPALKDIPASLELPVRYGYDHDFDFVLVEKEAVPLNKIRKVIEDSLFFMNKVLQN
jgi:sugar phosphate isomerase/epimerase